MNHDSFFGVVYRATARVRARKADLRVRIVDAARELIAVQGFGGAAMAQIAVRSGVATGTLYRYFPSKALLFAEVFRVASGHEVDVMAAAARGRGTPQQRAVRAIETWATRAILGRRLAYALIAEPVAPEIEAERLRYRQAYARVLADVVREGVEAGVFSVRDVDVAATALVGAMAEALVGPLAPDDDSLWDQEPHIIAALVDFCLNALRAEGPRHVDS